MRWSLEKFVNSWKKHWVTSKGNYFEITKDLIANTTSLLVEGNLWRMQHKMVDETSLKKFNSPNEAPILFCGGFVLEKLLEP